MPKNYHDRSCYLVPDDHPDVITKPSCVAYQWAKVTSTVALETAASAGLLNMKAPITAATMRKILDGAQETDELKNAHRSLLRAQGLIS